MHTSFQAAENRLDALALTERFLLWNFRAWACCCRAQRLPAVPVATAFANIGAPAAAIALDAAMTQLVSATMRPLTVSCPPFAGLSGDERTLLAAAAAAQCCDRARLARLFADILPPPASTSMARALMDLGTALAFVGILLPQPHFDASTEFRAPEETHASSPPAERQAVPIEASISGGAIDATARLADRWVGYDPATATLH